MSGDSEARFDCCANLRKASELLSAEVRMAHQREESARALLRSQTDNVIATERLADLLAAERDEWKAAVERVRALCDREERAIHETVPIADLRDALADPQPAAEFPAGLAAQATEKLGGNPERPPPCPDPDCPALYCETERARLAADKAATGNPAADDQQDRP